jgi:hypothetical protein
MTKWDADRWSLKEKTFDTLLMIFGHRGKSGVMTDGPRSFWAAAFTDLSSWPGFCALAVQRAHPWMPVLKDLIIVP